MKLDAQDIAELRPVITAVVEQVLEHVHQRECKLENGRLAYNEAEAAALLGIARHVLRDARLKGEIQGSRIGRKVLYSRDELVAFLRRAM
jgi:excisionase family DNA binding protein